MQETSSLVLGIHKVRSLLMDTPAHTTIEGLVKLATDKEDWNVSVNALTQRPKKNLKKRTSTVSNDISKRHKTNSNPVLVEMDDIIHRHW